MAELAQQSGVPAATIKHYLREGLLPRPALKTGRNMAYYHPAMVERVRAIKQLQEERYLPLKVIREVLDGADPYRTEDTREALRKALSGSPGSDEGPTRTRRELIAAGTPSEQLDFFEQIGFLTPTRDGGEDGEVRYGPDDVALLRTLRAARREGLSPEMLPHTIVGPYLEALRQLVRVELQMFREGLRNTMGNAETDGDIEGLVGSAARLSEQLVTLLRRKLLLPTLAELAKELEGERREEKDDDDVVA